VTDWQNCGVLCCAVNDCREAGSIQESMEGKFRKAIEGFENELVKNIEVGGATFWIELKSRGVLPEELIQICQSEVCRPLMLGLWKRLL